MITLRLEASVIPDFVQRCLHWCLVGLFILLSSTIFFVAVIVLVNWDDEELTSLSKELLQPDTKYSIPAQENSFFIFRGLDALPSENAWQTGLLQSESEEKAFLADPVVAQQSRNHAVIYPADVSNHVAIDYCNPSEVACVTFLLQHRAGLETRMQSQSVLEKRYEQMLDLGKYEDSAMSSIYPEPHKLALLQDAIHLHLIRTVFEFADGNPEQGMLRLQRNDKLLRQILANSSQILSKANALAALTEQISLISDLCDHFPELVQNYPEQLFSLAKPLSDNEKSMLRTFKGQAYSSLLSFYYQPDMSLPDKVLPFLGWEMMKITAQKATYQPQATTNAMAQYWSAKIALSRKTAPEFAAWRKAHLPKKTEEMAFSGMGYLYNPTGKAWINLNTSDQYERLMERVIDTDTLLRLLGLKLHILHEHVSDAEMLSYVMHAEIAYRNPVDNSAMVWNPMRRRLEFTAFEKNTASPGSKIFSLRLRPDVSNSQF